MTSKVELGFMMGNVRPAANASKGSQGAQDAFQGIMVNMTTTNMAANGQDASKAQDYQPKETAAVKETTAVKEPAAQSKEASESSISDKRPADTVKDAAGSGRMTENVDDKAAVSEAEEEILTQTAEELDITVEELEEILAQMGLTAWDLLEPENVSALVVQVMGDGDKMSLVTDENLSQTVLDLNAAMKEIGGELAEKLGVDEADIKAALDEIQGKMQDEEPVMPLQKTETAQTVNEKPVAVEQTKDVETEAGEEVQAVSEQALADAAKENSGSSSSDAQTGRRDSGLGRMENTAARHQTVREDQIGIFQQTVADAPVIQDMALEAARELMGSSPTEIINQINAYIRQNTAAHITEWQMQLNPEHLGTVNLNVTAREGAVTAQFTTQNEAVKAVMEAQVMILKENLEQQGIKVEAVEVTVASHEFEQNLQQGDDSNRQMEEEQENLRKATRKIDLGEFASPEDLEALDEAEQVTVEMMQADGNMMDYKV
ncbi:MAG: flagellar hook-length control protein FliK [Lachnospiraceae bacterium]|nr:flagellar hook-length control protein FliK [Lachnospiraceae bacterium]